MHVGRVKLLLSHSKGMVKRFYITFYLINTIFASRNNKAHEIVQLSGRRMFIRSQYNPWVHFLRNQLCHFYFCHPSHRGVNVLGSNRFLPRSKICFFNTFPLYLRATSTSEANRKPRCVHKLNEQNVKSNWQFGP